MNGPSPDKSSKVALFYELSLVHYPKHPPFDPSVQFPENPSAGVLAASLDAVALDTGLAWIMGYDPTRIRTIQGAGASREPFWLGHSNLERIEVISNLADWKGLNLDFQESLGWEGCLKRNTAFSEEIQERLRRMGPLE